MFKARHKSKKNASFKNLECFSHIEIVVMALRMIIILLMYLLNAMYCQSTRYCAVLVVQQGGGLCISPSGGACLRYQNRTIPLRLIVPSEYEPLKIFGMTVQPARHECFACCWLRTETTSAHSSQQAWHWCQAGCIVISENRQGLATRLVLSISCTSSQKSIEGSNFCKPP